MWLTIVMHCFANSASAEVINESGTELPPVFVDYAANIVEYRMQAMRHEVFDMHSLRTIESLVDAQIDFDLQAFRECVDNQLQSIKLTIGQQSSSFETSMVVTAITSNQGTGPVVAVEYTLSQTAAGGQFSHDQRRLLYLTDGKILGQVDRSDTPKILCLELATTRNGRLQSLMQQASAEPGASTPTDPSKARVDLRINNADGIGDEPIQSTGNNKWDLITVDDPSVLECVTSEGRSRGEIFDKRVNAAIVHPDAFHFTAYYRDGSSVSIRLHPEFRTQAAAEQEVSRYTYRIGQLPSVLRRNIQRLAVMRGDKTAMGDGGGEGIHIQSGNAALRESHNRLEETLFHEAVHTSLDDVHATSKLWRKAQLLDDKFLTAYGRKRAQREDFAETLLYVYAALHHQDRIPDNYLAEIRSRVPNRWAYIQDLLPPDEPIFTSTTLSNEACQNVQ